MESTLSLKLTDIQAKLGTFAGWGRGAVFGDPAWSSYQQAILDDCTQSGLRRFYYPELQQNSNESYCWSFLRPSARLTLVVGKNTIPLPDDFGAFEGAVTIQQSSGTLWGQVNVYNQGEIDAKYSLMPTTTGKPTMFAIRWLKGTTGAEGQRAQLYVWPLPDNAYPIQFQYYLLPDYLNGSFPYALGGMAHAETILESCLAVLEERLDDTSGVHAAAYSRRLAASISMDRRSKAQVLGYNGDRSDERGAYRPLNHWQNPIGYNGTAL